MSELAKALHAFQADSPPIHFDATNPHFRSKYASLAGVVEAIRPALNKVGLVYTQLPSVTDLGAPAVETRLIHAETGEELSSTMPLILPKQDPQGQGSALTYARRYALLSILGLVGDEDDDANKASRGADGDSASGNGAGSSRTLHGSPAPPSPGPEPVGVDGPGPGSPFTPPAGATNEPSGSEPPDDGGDPGSGLLTFGKHKGKRIREVPEAYLRWWVQQEEPKTADLRRQRAAVNMFLNGPQTSEFSDETIPF